MADNIQGFIKELAFEEALTHHLLDHGWNEVIKNPTEEQLVQNWADIIYDNNREIDKLGNYPLTASEMKQVMDQVNMKSSPYEMNRFINGKQVCIKRDNEADTNNLHCNIRRDTKQAACHRNQKQRSTGNSGSSGSAECGKNTHDQCSSKVYRYTNCIGCG